MSIGKDFPMDCVAHLSRCTCHCQHSAPDVSENRHVKSCMVGQAQQYLGQNVTDKSLYCGSRHTVTQKRVDMSIELKPCPFCGNKDIKMSGFFASRLGQHLQGQRVFCPECRTDGPAFYSDKSESPYTDAAEAWNKRHTVNGKDK